MAELTPARRVVVGMSVVIILAVVTTIVRLCIRGSRKHLWYDDAWVGVGSLFALWGVVRMLVFAFPTDALFESVPLRAFFIWTGLFAQPIAIWSCRASVHATFVYILPRGKIQNICRNGMIGMAVCWFLVSLTRIFFGGVPVRAIPVGPFPKGPYVVDTIIYIFGTVWLAGLSGFLMSRNEFAKQRPVFAVAFFMFLLTFSIQCWTIYNDYSPLARGFNGTISYQLETVLAVLTPNVLVFVAYGTGVGRDGLPPVAPGPKLYQPHPSTFAYNTNTGLGTQGYAANQPYGMTQPYGFQQPYGLAQPPVQQQPQNFQITAQGNVPYQPNGFAQQAPMMPQGQPGIPILPQNEKA